MALNFPDTPSLNQTFTGDGTVWKWDGSAWDIYSVSSSVVALDDYYLKSNPSGFIVSDITTGISQTPISGASVVSNIINITQSAYESLYPRESGVMYVIVT